MMYSQKVPLDVTNLKMRKGWRLPAILFVLMFRSSFPHSIAPMFVNSYNTKTILFDEINYNCGEIGCYSLFLMVKVSIIEVYNRTMINPLRQYHRVWHKQLSPTSEFYTRRWSNWDKKFCHLIDKVLTQPISPTKPLHYLSI